MEDNNVNANKRVAITTFDNPFNPITEFNDWNNFDTEKGYYTCNYLGRITHISDGMSQVEYDREVERAIDSIITSDPFNLYKKVEMEDNAA